MPNTCPEDAELSAIAAVALAASVTAMTLVLLGVTSSDNLLVWKRALRCKWKIEYRFLAIHGPCLVTEEWLDRRSRVSTA